MRILFTIPHFFEHGTGTADDGRPHGAVAGDREQRIRAAAACILALHQLYCKAQCQLDIARKSLEPANQLTADRVDVVVCTAQDRHLLEDLPVPEDYYQHYETTSEPALLGFMCHEVLREWVGAYDYYCYLEDDIVLRDPLFFVKLAWFSGNRGAEALLQPNRFEVSARPGAHKLYVDGALRPDVTAPFQDITDTAGWEANVMGARVAFERTRNPHSGCFFLNARQMETWASRPYFLDRDTSFVGPLESAATLGIMRTFKVYKPAVENAAFLEVEHADPRFIQQVRVAEWAEHA